MENKKHLYLSVVMPVFGLNICSTTYTAINLFSYSRENQFWPFQGWIENEDLLPASISPSAVTGELLVGFIKIKSSQINQEGQVFY